MSYWHHRHAFSRKKTFIYLFIFFPHGEIFRCITAGKVDHCRENCSTKGSWCTVKTGVDSDSAKSLISSCCTWFLLFYWSVVALTGSIACMQVQPLLPSSWLRLTTTPTPPPPTPSPQTSVESLWPQKPLWSRLSFLFFFNKATFQVAQRLALLHHMQQKKLWVWLPVTKNRRLCFGFHY